MRVSRVINELSVSILTRNMINGILLGGNQRIGIGGIGGNQLGAASVIGAAPLSAIVPALLARRRATMHPVSCDATRDAHANALAAPHRADHRDATRRPPSRSRYRCSLASCPA